MEQVGALFGVRQNKTALIIDGKTEVISAEAAVFASRTKRRQARKYR